MPELVTPEVYLVGFTTLDSEGLDAYLKASGNLDFWQLVHDARARGLSDGEILTSFYAKVCYASLTLGKNDNIEKVRDIPANLIGTCQQGHGSVWEHVNLNFIVRNCSRVLTHELVRHRVGTAFSQTSGRYVRSDLLSLVFDPILAPVKELMEAILVYLEEKYRELVLAAKLDAMTDFTLKKKWTSALRRILINGQANEIGFSANLRTLRHTVQVRTSRHSEWEIREVFNQVYRLTKKRWPLLYYGAKEEVVDGLLEVSGMKLQPYEKTDVSQTT